VSVAVWLLMHPRCRRATAFLVSDAGDVLNEFCGAWRFRFDAYVLADVLRTDRARLRPLIPDSPATVTLRQACRARQDLVHHRVAVSNQLRAHLLSVFPGAVGLFCRLDSAISLAFLARFSCRTAPVGCR
jgi:Transposase